MSSWRTQRVLRRAGSLPCETARGRDAIGSGIEQVGPIGQREAEGGVSEAAAQQMAEDAIGRMPGGATMWRVVATGGLRDEQCGFAGAVRRRPTHAR
jgi:hypothetical protein